MASIEVVQQALLDVSATQIDTFCDCQRKWAWNKIEGLKPPSAMSAQLGSDVHNRLENFLLKGVLDTTDRVGKIAEAGITHLPQPGTCNVEKNFVIESEIARYRGKMDAHWVKGAVSHVLDHKTTSDFKWMKTPDVLVDDVQANVYATAAMILDGTNTVDQTWVYYLTSNKPRSKVVRLRVRRDDAEPRFEKIEGIVREMRDIVTQGKRALDLPPSPQTCMKYGGCAFVSNCKLTTKELTRSLYMQMSLAEKLKAKLNGQAAATAAEQPTEAAPAAASKPARTSAPKINPDALSSATEAAVEKSVASIAAGAAAAAETTRAPTKNKAVTNDLQERRETFARSAMEGLLARGTANLAGPQGLKALASLSFEIADAMMAES